MDSEEKFLIDKYEIHRYNGESMYFDLTEFDIIISHYIYEEQYFDALEALVHAKLCHPYNLDLELFKIEIMIQMEEYVKAMELINTLEVSMKNYYEINLFKGQILLAMDKPEEAFLQFDEAISKNESSFRGDYEPDIYDIPELLINKLCYESALAILSKLYEVNSENVDVLCQMAYCYENTSEVEKAEKYYEKALDVNPFDEKTWLSLGILCVNNSNYEKALNAFEFALAINGENYSAALYKANTLLVTGKYDEAIEWLNSFKLNDASFMYLIGKCYEEKSDMVKAVEYYTEAIKQDNEFSLPYWSVSKILYANDNLHLAIKAIDKALEYDADNLEYIYFRGLCMIGLAIGLKKFSALKKNAKKGKNIANEIDIPKTVSDENSPEETDISENYKLAVFFYHLGDVESCCKCLLNSTNLSSSSLELFFEQAPEARNDAYIINYLGKYLK